MSVLILMECIAYLYAISAHWPLPPTSPQVKLSSVAGRYTQNPELEGLQ